MTEEFSYSISDCAWWAQIEYAYARRILDAIKSEITQKAIAELRTKCSTDVCLDSSFVPAQFRDVVFLSILQQKNMGIKPDDVFRPTYTPTPPDILPEPDFVPEILDVPEPVVDIPFRYKARPVYSRTQMEENNMNIYIKMVEETTHVNLINAPVQIRPFPSARNQKYADKTGVIQSVAADLLTVTIYLYDETIYPHEAIAMYSVVLSDFQFMPE